ncbi:MAG: response regulator [Proteobacteria bacterium]|nr:response regulator [Pseudomonadota bacterium]
MASILVIDDEKDLLWMFNNVLERNGHKVFMAENGFEGMLIFENEHLDLVITDLMMPVMDGHEVAMHIRTSEKGSIPVIGMSGTPWEIMPDHFEAVIEKPFFLGILIDKVRDLTLNPPNTVYSM